MASSTARLIVCFMAMAAVLQVTSATEYEVGGSFGWNEPPNSTFYSEWASTKTFFVGDELLFKSNGSMSDNFAEPSTQSEYENCTDPGIIFLLPENGLTRTFVRSGPHYFISTVDNHCENGQKFAINVSAIPGMTPSSAPSLSYGSVSALLVTAAALIFY